MCHPDQEVADALALAHSAEVRARIARRAASFRRERQRRLDQALTGDVSGASGATGSAGTANTRPNGHPGR